MCVLLKRIVTNGRCNWLKRDAAAVRPCVASSCCLKRKNHSFKSLIFCKCTCRSPNELHGLSVGVLCECKRVAYLKIVPFPWGIWTSFKSNTRFHGLTRVFTPNGISIGSIVFAWLTNVTNTHARTHTHRDRQTDRQTDRLTKILRV